MVYCYIGHGMGLKELMCLRPSRVMACIRQLCLARMSQKVSLLLTLKIVIHVAEEILPRPGIEPTTFALKDRQATYFAKELSPLSRVVIIQVSHSILYSHKKVSCHTILFRNNSIEHKIALVWPHRALQPHKPNICRQWYHEVYLNRTGIM